MATGWVGRPCGAEGAGRCPPGPPEAGGEQPAPRNARRDLGRAARGPPRAQPSRAASPRPPPLLFICYLFIYFGRGKSLKCEEGDGGGELCGEGGWETGRERERKKKRRPPSVRPRDFPCRRAQGRAVPVPAGEEGGGGRGGGGAGGAPAPPPPRGRRGSRRCAPELLLVTPAPPPASLPLLASDSAHSQPRSLSFCKTQFTQQRERAGEVERERETARRGAQSRNPAWLRGTFTR